MHLQSSANRGSCKTPEKQECTLNRLEYFGLQQSLATKTQIQLCLLELLTAILALHSIASLQQIAPRSYWACAPQQED
jgi:hypothetical protein